MRDRLRGLVAHVTGTSPHSPKDTRWQRLHMMSPVQAVSKRAADRFVRSGDDHKRCAFADLHAAQQSISRDIFELLDAEHSKLSVVRQHLFKARHETDEDVFMDSWRYKRDAKSFHRTVQNTVNGCAMLATRPLRTSGSASIHYFPAINVTPPSPSLHATYLSCEASDADDSFNLPTPTDSDFSHEGLQDGKVHIHNNPSTTNLCMDIPSSFASEKPFLPMNDVETDMDVEVCHTRLPSLAEENEEDVIMIQVDEAPINTMEAENSADVPRSPSEDSSEGGNISPSSSSGSELTAELMTAEVMVGTPVTSGSASFVDDCSFEAVAYTGVYYEDPAEYVDRYLHGYGVDPRQYWGLFSSLSRTILQQIADLFQEQGLIAGLDMLESLLRQYAVQLIRSRTPQATETTETNDVAESVTFYTTELVSPSDSLVTSPRPPLAGAVGEIVCPPNSEILELREVHDDPEDTDQASIVAEPYGPSRSTTVDDQLVGEAPDGHLGDQFALMMRQLPYRASTSTFGTPHSTPKTTRIPPEQLAPEIRQQQDEHPRLWNIRLSPQPKVMSLPVTPVSNDDELGLAF